MHCRPRASTCSLTEVSSRRTSKSASEPTGLSALAVSVGSVRVGSHTVGADIAVRTGSTKGTEFPGLGPVTAPARASEMNSSYVPHGALGEKLINFVAAETPKPNPNWRRRTGNHSKPAWVAREAPRKILVGTLEISISLKHRLQWTKVDNRLHKLPRRKPRLPKAEQVVGSCRSCRKSPPPTLE